ncbi:MAG: MBL fold metallo-hydrolase [Deltaproteobacteria bacterium]|nr:MBL fold metallo-hydrolase [Deltaproteobacteria bacterium]
MKIHFLGAAQTVTGSLYVVELGDRSLVVDCGLYQGRRADARRINRDVPKLAARADAAILTHAHIDHSGNLPTLVKRGFTGRIHCTSATADLCESMLRDAARIQVADARWLNKKRHLRGDEEIIPLYDEDDAQRALGVFVPHAYQVPFEPIPGVTARLFDAGHVLGSASVCLDIELSGFKRRLVFSGDIGRKNLPILRDPQLPPAADYVVMESTYGNRLHAPVEQMDEQLASAVDATLRRGGKVIVPSFALERTQEIVFAFNRLVQSGRLAPLAVFVDSPLAVNLTEVFRRHPECYDEAASAFDAAHGDPFGFEQLQMIESVQESKRLNDFAGPAVIISASGMCEAGRILHHLRNTIENPNNSVVIVGYQAAHTLGRRIVERRERVKIFGVERDLNAAVFVLNAFSAHADRAELLDWAEGCGEQVRQFFLVHGEVEPAQALAETLRERGRDVVIPSPGQAVALS